MPTMQRSPRSPLRCPWLLVFLLSATAFPIGSTSAEGSTYIVYMDNSAKPVAFSDDLAWYTAILSATGDSSRTADAQDPYLIYAYRNAIRGFSARLSGSQLKKLKTYPGFLSAQPDYPVQLHTTHTPEFLGLSAAAGIWPESRYGGGAIIGVVDTGIWPESGSFKDSGMPAVPSRWRGACEEGDNFSSAACNRKLIGARYFNRGLLAGNPNLTISVNSARDTDGHGTRAASTAAGSAVAGASYFGYGNGTARGVAPRAHLAVYKVFWNEGSSASDVLAGIDQAMSDGVDVLSLSLSLGNVPLDENPLAVASLAAVERGVFVSTAAGNDGPTFKSINRGIPWALTVGASTVDRQFAGTVVLGDGTAVDGGSLYIGEPPSTGRRRLALVDDCNDEDKLSPYKDNIVICVSYSGFFEDMLIAVRLAKVSRVIFITYSYYLTQFAKFTVAATLVDLDNGRRILDYMNKTANPTAELRFRRTVLGTKPAPTVARYSSRGPSLSCPNVLKPDLVAPGSLVLASSAGGRDSFDISSGTSAACAHASGVAAMVKMLHPDWSPAAIRSAMMTTAVTVDNTGKRMEGSGLALGSGQLDPNRAADPGLVYDAGIDDYVNYLCAANYTKRQIRAIAGFRPKKLDCSRASSDLNYPSFIAYFDPSGPANYSAVRVFRRTVTNVAGGAWVYTARVTGMDGFKIGVRPHRLVFREKGEKQSFTVTIVGHRTLGNYDVIDGALSWVDGGGKHVVKSPIVATTHNLPDSD